ncbi:MAG: N-acetylmuramoyl-L-alanine amidase [Bdellovibrionales bacterium]
MHIIPHPSPNFGPRLRPLEYIILHYTDHLTLQQTLDALTNPARQVSAHYVLDYDGTLYQLVDDEMRAWHAGISSWKGITDMNSASIGIEIENPGHSNGYVPFTEAQIKAVIELCSVLTKKHGISPRNVIGHSDVAPARKEDPGHLFPWDRLAAAGFGIWPKKESAVADIKPVDAQKALEMIGYDVSDFDAALLAFQRHFCPAEMGKKLTPATGGWLKALAG